MCAYSNCASAPGRRCRFGSSTRAPRRTVRRRAGSPRGPETRRRPRRMPLRVARRARVRRVPPSPRSCAVEGLARDTATRWRACRRRRSRAGICASAPHEVPPIEPAVAEADQASKWRGSRRKRTTRTPLALRRSRLCACRTAARLKRALHRFGFGRRDRRANHASAPAKSPALKADAAEQHVRDRHAETRVGRSAPPPRALRAIGRWRKASPRARTAGPSRPVVPPAPRRCAAKASREATCAVYARASAAMARRRTGRRCDAVASDACFASAVLRPEEFAQEAHGPGLRRWRSQSGASRDHAPDVHRTVASADRRRSDAIPATAIDFCIRTGPIGTTSFDASHAWNCRGVSPTMPKKNGPHQRPVRIAHSSERYARHEPGTYLSTADRGTSSR